MSREIAISGWAEQWLERTHHCLSMESSIFVLVFSLVGLVASIISLVAVMRLRRARTSNKGELRIKPPANSTALVKNNPSNRAALFAGADKRMLQATKCHFYISNAYVVHALGIWVVDASIGILAIAQDVNASPDAYDARLWLDLAIHSIGVAAIFAAVFVLFPAAQMALAGYIISRRHKNNPEGTLKTFVPAARQITTHMGHLWSLAGFLIMIWWPVFERTTIRIIVLEAVFGSAMAWLHASYIFNFRAEQLEHVEVQPLLSVRDGVKMYGQQVYAVHSGKGKGGLPQYETMAQTEPLLSEKMEQ